MRVSPTVRVLGVCTIVITAIIGSSYALGQATPTKFKPEASSVSQLPPAADAAATSSPAASPTASPAASPAPDGGRAPVRQGGGPARPARAAAGGGGPGVR